MEVGLCLYPVIGASITKGPNFTIREIVLAYGARFILFVDEDRDARARRDYDGCFDNASPAAYELGLDERLE